MERSRICFIFNAHLPFVRHPEYPRFLEEDWLFEAINESYIPLLRMMYRLNDSGIPFCLTFSISPTLCSMLLDRILMERFVSYMENHIELGEKETVRLADCTMQLEMAQRYLDNLRGNLAFFRDKCNGNILNAFNELSNEGCLELVTTAATHAFLPLFKDYPVAVNAQIETGVLSHILNFDRPSSGFWLPECGYYPGIEKYLVNHGVKWTSVASQALLLSKNVPEYGNSVPVKTPNELFCFARDYNLTSLVWSSSAGYPSDSVYREFYRDIGYDLPIQYIGPYIHEPEIRVFTGFKYWAITGRTADKKPYDYQAALKRVGEHALNFIYKVKERGNRTSHFLNDDPVFTVSFDAELFGHRWYEGIDWLESVIRIIADDSSISLISPGSYIKEGHEVQTMIPGLSTWARGGYSQDWVDSGTNAWLIRYIFKSVERMNELADRFPSQRSLKQRFLNQAARETLLAMSSDWPVIIRDNTSAEYAKKRVVCHVQNLNLVYDSMCRNAVNTEWLVKAERRDNLFPFIDYNSFRTSHVGEPSLIYTSDFSYSR